MRDFFNRSGIDQPGGPARDFAQCVDIGTEYGRATRHSLENREPEAFTKRGENQHFCTAIQRRKVIVLDISEFSYVWLQAEVSDRRVQPIRGVTPLMGSTAG